MQTYPAADFVFQIAIIKNSVLIFSFKVLIQTFCLHILKQILVVFKFCENFLTFFCFFDEFLQNNNWKTLNFTNGSKKNSHFLFFFSWRTFLVQMFWSTFLVYCETFCDPYFAKFWFLKYDLSKFFCLNFRIFFMPNFHFHGFFPNFPVLRICSRFGPWLVHFLTKPSLVVNRYLIIFRRIFPLPVYFRSEIGNCLWK